MELKPAGEHPKGADWTAEERRALFKLRGKKQGRRRFKTIASLIEDLKS